MTERHRLSDADLEEIERLARDNAGEPYRGPLLALVDEVRRLREVVSGAGLVLPFERPEALADD